VVRRAWRSRRAGAPLHQSSQRHAAREILVVDGDLVLRE